MKRIYWCYRDDARKGMYLIAVDENDAMRQAAYRFNSHPDFVVARYVKSSTVPEIAIAQLLRERQSKGAA